MCRWVRVEPLVGWHPAVKKVYQIINSILRDGVINLVAPPMALCFTSLLRLLIKICFAVRRTHFYFVALRRLGFVLPLAKPPVRFCGGDNKIKYPNHKVEIFYFGGSSQDRTGDTRLFKPLLYR